MALEFIADPDTKPGIAYQPQKGLTRVVAPNASPFTYTGTGTYLIGRKELCVIDPGPADNSHLKALLDAISNRPRQMCIRDSP